PAWRSCGEPTAAAPDAEHQRRGKIAAAELDALSQGIAMAETARQALGERDDDAAFAPEPRTLYGGRQFPCRGDERLGAVEQAVDDAAQPGAGTGCRELRDGAAAFGEIRLGQIDAIERAVIGGAILQVIEHLERAAQRIGGRPRRALLAMEVEELASHRRGGVAAIRHEVVPV